MVKTVQQKILDMIGTGKRLELMHVRSHLGDRWNDVVDTFAKWNTPLAGTQEVMAKMEQWNQEYQALPIFPNG